MDANKFAVRQETTETEIRLYLEGELDLSTAPQLRTAVEPFLEQTDKRLVLNLESLKYIDSTGIGVLISILKNRESQDSEFAVEQVPPKIKRLFDLTGITKFLKVEQVNFEERTENQTWN